MAVKLPKKQPFANLRPTADYAVEWEAVEEATSAREPRPIDDLGLTREDRIALGMSPSATPAPTPPKDDARGVLSRALP